MALLSELLTQVMVESQVPGNLHVTGIANNSLDVRQGALFIGYPGHRQDGRHFLHQAIESGAVACLVEAEGFVRRENYVVPIVLIRGLRRYVSLIAARFYNNVETGMRIVGVTGTNGKTTVAQLLAQALHARGNKTAVLGTAGNGIWPELEYSPLTTLDPIDLQKKIRFFSENDVNNLIMEVSSHALAQHRVEAVNFNIGVFTNLTHDHLDFHGNFDSYAQAKYRLFHFESMEYGVVNLDDACGRALLDERSDLDWVGYSLSKNVKDNFPVVYPTSLVQTKFGYTAELVTPWGNGTFQIPLLGRFNVSNMLAVICSLGIMGYSISDMQAAVAILVGVKGRMQVVSTKGQPLVLIDYAHTPDALEKVLIELRGRYSGDIWCLFGCGGDRDKDKRALMGTVAEQYADKIVLTGDNSRSEPTAEILQQIRSGISVHAVVHEIEDRAQAIAFVVQSAAIDDIVLLAGRGHEQYLLIDGQRIPLEDEEVACHALTHVR